MIKSGNNTIGKVYRVSQDARNLLKGSKDLGATWTTDYPSNSTWTSTLNSDGVREYTQTAQSTELINRHLFVENKLPDSVLNLFIPGKTYTLSFEYKSNAQIFSAVSLRNSAYASVVSVIPNTTFPASTTWKRVSITQVLPTFITTDVTRLLLEASIHRNTHSVGDTASFRKFCLVEGTDTNWSPAASEVDVNITKVYKENGLVYESVKIPETDIALYDNVENYEITVPTSKYNATDYPTSRYTPTGIVVIPADHSRVLYSQNHECYGKPIIMSLKNMSCQSPDTGGNDSVYYGHFGQSISAISDYTKSSTIQNNSTLQESILESSGSYSILPSDNSIGVRSKSVRKLYYADSPYCPSPYLFKNGNLQPNPEFYDLSLIPETCVQRDRDGKANTQALINRVSPSDSWKTDETITNNWEISYRNGKYYRYCPAACCCWRYHIEGIDNQGDWYLPALGELCYIIPFITRHNEALNKINTVIGSSVAISLTNSYYHSSSESGTDNNWVIYRVDNKILTTSKKNYSVMARAFRPLKVKSDLGNAILVNKTTLKKISVPVDKLSDYSPNEYEPIGVVVIPTEHNVYGIGECGVMALMSASLNTPDTGQTSNTNITWGAYDTDYPELTNFNEVIRMGTMNNDISDDIDGLSLYGYIPLMRNGMSSKFECPHDTKAKYYDNTSSSYGYIPSPYLNDGSRNPDYYDTSFGSNNALSDFAGKSNTEFSCSKATAQPDWKTDKTLSSKIDAGYYPAACCCWRFHTMGTNQGDWYLPACGELGYIIPRYDMINDTITTLQTHFGKTFCSLAKGSVSYYWSSSEHSSIYVRSVGFGNGVVNYGTKSSGNNVRPFLRGNFETIN